MQALETLFHSRSGIQDLVDLYSNESSIIAYISVSDPEYISTTSKGVLQYHRTQHGSFFGGVNLAAWETITQLTFGSDGKITNILVNLLDPKMINSVYPAQS